MNVQTSVLLFTCIIKTPAVRNFRENVHWRIFWKYVKIIQILVNSNKIFEHFSFYFFLHHKHIFFATLNRFILLTVTFISTINSTHDAFPIQQWLENRVNCCVTHTLHLCLGFCILEFSVISLLSSWIWNVEWEFHSILAALKIKDYV